MATISFQLGSYTLTINNQLILSTEVAKRGSKHKRVCVSTVKIYIKWKASYTKLVKFMSLILKTNSLDSF